MSYDVEMLRKRGYCTVSNRHGILSRIDRENWREYMAERHMPANPAKGMEWVKILGDQSAADFYRRCVSKDWIEGVPTSVWRKLGNSHNGPGVYLP